jgi:RNA polymerase sigma factor (sigma-70 family)
MVDGRTTRALFHVARVFQNGTFLGMPDRQVLERFVEHRDEAAFEVLLSRHGPMVRRVCRQLLVDSHDGDDAFQAVFLALVQKARSIRVDDSLGPWLYTVANRVAARARAKRSRLGAREPSGRELPDMPCRGDLDGFEIHRVVHEELGRLPERLRAPMVLCYLEGMTHDLAARQLDCPVGTVRSRLARARGLLEGRLSRRGLAVTVAAAGGLLESTAKAASISPALPMSLITLVTRATSQSIRRNGLGMIGSIAALLKGVMNVSPIKKLTILATAGLSIGAVVFAVTAHSKVPGQTRPGAGERGAFEVDHSRLGLDGRPIGGRRAEPKTAMVTKTYYVGDLIGPPARTVGMASGSIVRAEDAMAAAPDGLNSGSKLPASGESEPPNFTPLVELITQTVAPGTWTASDARGQTVPSRITGGKAIPPERQGTITPFFLSISLIIRCTPEKHEQVANLLRGLRLFVDSRESPGVVFDRPSEPTELPATGTQPVKPAPPPADEPTTKIERLLNELREEVKKLDRAPAGKSANEE